MDEAQTKQVDGRSAADAAQTLLEPTGVNLVRQLREVD